MVNGFTQYTMKETWPWTLFFQLFDLDIFSAKSATIF